MSHIQNIRKHATRKKHGFAKDLRRRLTPAEKVIWEHLKRRQIGWKVTRQRVLFGWIADFYCGVKGVAIEIDGGYHDQQRGKDRFRDSVLLKKGIVTLRYTNQQVTDDTDGVVKSIKSVCDSRESVGREG